MRTAARGAQTAKAMAEAVADAAAGGNHGELGGVLKRMNRIAQWRK